MKTYFNFNLTGKKLFPIWVLFLTFFFVPYGFIILKMGNVQPDVGSSMWLFLPLMLLVFIAFALTFYITKLTIENISLKDQSILFNGTFGKFIGTVLLGTFLSIITLGVYMAWFIRDIQRFFIDHSTYDSHALKFQGKGGKLFVILLLTIVVPMIILSIVLARFMVSDSVPSTSMIMVQQLMIILIMIPYMYLVYKWMVNVDYKDFNISWKTDFWSSCGKIAIEVILSIITLGIYAPLAMLRLYKYFAERTFAESNEKTIGFGYDIDPLNDFFFIWGQTLLMIITLGIYYPWAFCKIGSRMLGKTYLLEKQHQ